MSGLDEVWLYIVSRVARPEPSEAELCRLDPEPYIPNLYIFKLLIKLLKAVMTKNIEMKVGEAGGIPKVGGAGGIPKARSRSRLKKDRLRNGPVVLVRNRLD